MKAERLVIPEVILLEPPRHVDSRGFFSETWNAVRWSEYGIPAFFVQDNHSLSIPRGVIRGLHLQIDPNAQGKLIRVTRGAIWDVAVDVRVGSETYGKHVSAVLSAENWSQLWIPPGFLHGFCTIEPDTEVLYKVTAPYDPDTERGVAWNDPDLNIPWPVNTAEAVLSERDVQLPRLADCPVWFRL
jgi:dTDP-4-dehydrorhamnose 3,5-epimerase